MGQPRRAPKSPAGLSLRTLVGMGLGSLAILAALIWLALAYAHAALLAVLLPILPVLFSFFVEECRKTLEDWREEETSDEPLDQAQPPPVPGS